MKKFFLVFFAIAIYSATNAQSQIGIKAGANFPDLTGSNVPGTVHNKTGFYTGLLMNLPVRGRFYVEPELLWSVMGYKYTELGAKFSTTFDYVQLVALAKYGSYGFHFETGPQLGLLVSAKRKGGTLGTEDIKDSFKSTAFSWAAGVGYCDPVGYGLELRYIFGIGTISQTTNANFRFNVLMLGISKTFGVKAKSK